MRAMQYPPVLRFAATLCWVLSKAQIASSQDKAAVLTDVRTIIAEQLGTDLDKVRWMLRVVLIASLPLLLCRSPPTPSLSTWVPTRSTRCVVLPIGVPLCNTCVYRLRS